MLVCFNGTFLPHDEAVIHPDDGALLFGDTLFETLKACRERILLVSEHLDRLEKSARLLELPVDRPHIERCLNQLAAALDAPCSRVRLTVGRGICDGFSWPEAAAGWFLLTASSYPALGADERLAGVSCVSAPNRRVNPLSHLPQMKRGNYADCLYAANHARRSGAREALFVDPSGQVLEGATSNIFALIDDRLVTPAAGPLILDGIMRRQVMAAAAELGILVVERALLLDELLQADEAFLTNSLIEILPVAQFDNRPLQRGELWASLLETLRIRTGQ